MSDPIEEAERKNRAAMKAIDQGAEKMVNQVATVFSLPWPRKPVGHSKGPSRPTTVKGSQRSRGHVRGKSWPIGNWKGG